MEEIAEIKRQLFWLGISCMCSGIGLILCSILFQHMERRINNVASHTNVNHRNIETLFAIQERKVEPKVEIVEPAPIPTPEPPAV
jgi:hypothetical protein